MNAIEQNYNKSITVERFEDSDESGDTTESYSAYLIGVACHIQPLEDAYGEDLDGNSGKDYLMFCEVLDIKERDKIVDGTEEYKVVGVKSFNFLGANRHMELRIRKFNG